MRFDNYEIRQERKEEHRQKAFDRQKAIEDLNQSFIEELKTRKLEDIPTEQLIKLILLTNKQLDSQSILIAKTL